jgi:hypothetical protein
MMGEQTMICERGNRYYREAFIPDVPRVLPGRHEIVAGCFDIYRSSLVGNPSIISNTRVE